MLVLDETDGNLQSISKKSMMKKKKKLASAKGSSTGTKGNSKGKGKGQVITAAPVSAKIAAPWNIE